MMRSYDVNDIKYNDAIIQLISPKHMINFDFSLNLYELIKKNNYQGFSINLIRRFAYSLIQCLRLLRRENIIHCDLKPVTNFLSNCLKRQISNVKYPMLNLVFVVSWLDESNQGVVEWKTNVSAFSFCLISIW